MLTEQPLVAMQLRPSREPLTQSRRVRRRPRPARAVAFAGAAALILVYALRGGGSYDSAVFEEHGLVIWWVLAVGGALGLLPRTRPPKLALVLLGSLAAYVGWTAVSFAWTSSAELTTVELARALDYLGLATLVVCVLDRDTWRPAAAGLGFGALVVCAAAVGSRLAPSLFGTDRIDTAFHIDRLSQPFGYWNSVTAWGAMCVALALAWSAHDTSRPRRALALALVPVAALTVYLTYSRAGVAGAALALVAVLGLSRNRITALVHIVIAGAASVLPIVAVRGAPPIAHASGTRGAGRVLVALLVACAACGAGALLTALVRLDRLRLPRRVARAVAAVFAVLALIVAGAFGVRLAARGWHSFTRGTVVQSSANPTARLSSGLAGSRYPLWKASLKAFAAHPFGGTGAGTIEFWWNQHGSDAEFVRDAHNLWLENLAELGAPGLILLVAVTGSALALVLTVRGRTRRNASAGAAAALGAVFVVYLLHASVDWMWESTAVTVLALCAVAVLAARLSEGTLSLRPRVRAPLVLLAVLAACVQVPGVLSTTAIRRSQAAERAGQVGLALAWARDAVSAEPWSASAYEQRALVLESEGRFAPAARDLSSAISREPLNYVHWLLLARVQTERGRLADAERDYRRAHSLRPRATVFALAGYLKR
jgi:O-Antigen ligase